MDRFAELAEVFRGDIVESRHFGVAAVANAEGEVIAGWGDPDLITYPRSSMKPFQALALLESGAAQEFGLTPQHLALACASHNGEAHHTELVSAWLEAIGASQQHLACGAAIPKNAATYEAMMAAGERPTRLHHNCSGKHTGFLTVCRHRGFAMEGYAATDHPTHALYAAALDDLGAHVAGWARDGCTLPTPAMAVGEVARIGARFAAGHGAAPRREAMRTLLAAMRAHPAYVSGTDHPMGALIEATGGRVVFKGGAEAFLLAFLERDGLAIAIKVADGNSRARVPALIAILQHLQLLSREEARALNEHATPVVCDSRGDAVGRIRPLIGGGNAQRAMGADKAHRTIDGDGLQPALDGAAPGREA